MRRAIRAAAAMVIVLHGLIHLFGAAKGLGWADVSQLKDPISTSMGVVWLAAAALVTASGVLLGVGARRWWMTGGLACIASQAVIFTSWSDAGLGTVANAILLAAVVYGYASAGPRSYRAEYRRLVTAALADSPPADVVVTEADLAHLPALVAAYLRRCGVVGQPRVLNFRATVHGRIRAAPTKPWMTFSGEQVNTFSPQHRRLFWMDATLFGLPVDVLHVFVGDAATMRVKACSIVPIVNAAGPEMDRGETVTMFNDLCVLAPAAIVDAPITWRTVGKRRVQGAYTRGTVTVTADLTFNGNDELVDFVSEDRSRASTNGKSFTQQRWSTPIHSYQRMGKRRVAAAAEAQWHLPEPRETFVYVELYVDEVEYNAPGRRLSSHPTTATAPAVLLAPRP